MTIQYPVSGGFIRLAGKWVDEAFGFMAGWVRNPADSPDNHLLIHARTSSCMKRY
jgi:hypothetical protein